MREYKGELYRKFVLKLKKEKLWNKFRILEYYFRFYTNEENNLERLISYYKNDNNSSIIPFGELDGGWKRGSFGTYFDGCGRDIKLKEFYKYYKV